MPGEDRNSDVTPDSLMDQFKGKGLKPILTFTLVVHVVVILGSSIPFFIREAFARDNAKLSEEERIENAVEDATTELRKIAKKHGLNPQDISDQFSGRSKTAKAPRTNQKSPDVAPGPEAAAPATDDPSKSAYVTNLESKAKGPTVPTFEDEEDDIF